MDVYVRCRPFVWHCSTIAEAATVRLSAQFVVCRAMAAVAQTATRMGWAHIQIQIQIQMHVLVLVLMLVLVPNWLVGCCKLKAAAGPLCRAG